MTTESARPNERKMGSRTQKLEKPEQKLGEIGHNRDEILNSFAISSAC
jgi:hypothetical protein